MENDSQLGRIGREVQEYVKLSVDEVKLKATRGLSTALSAVLAYLLIVCVLGLVLGLLSLALLQWLNGILGAPWGTLIVAGVALLVLLILWLARKKLFRDKFVELFINVFYENYEDE